MIDALHFDTVIETEEVTGDVILSRRTRREVRFVPDTESFGMKQLTRETPLSTARYERRRWGPFGWWERVEFNQEEQEEGT